MADITTMREEQARDRQEVLITMINDLEEAVIRDQAKLEGNVKELLEPEETEQRLREKLSRLRLEEETRLPLKLHQIISLVKYIIMSLMFL